MKLLELKKILNPIRSMVELGEGREWPLIDKEVCFPDDYVEFINCYGSAGINYFLAIFNPFAEGEFTNFFERRKMFEDDYHYFENIHPGCSEFNIYPAEGGLLPFGETDTGDYFAWTTSPNVDSNLWGTAIVGVRGSGIEFFDCGMVELLENLFSKKIKTNVLSDTCFEGDVFDVK